MERPSEAELIERVRSLPPGGPLLACLGAASGVHLVGGAVRDLLMGGMPPDLDLVVEGDAAQIARRLGGEVRFHDRFGTSTVRLDGFSYDIAAARRESYARPGALPDVEPATLAEDLLRRDFTVNAIALALGPPVPGALTEAPRALDDLSKGLLRVLHDGSFEDDPTRLLRLLRYATRLGFEVEPHTAQLADDAVRGGALQTVSGSRVGAELRLLAREPDPVAALAALGRWGIGDAIHPGIGIGDPAAGRHALELLPEDARRDWVALALAFTDVRAQELPELLDRLAFSAADRDAIRVGVMRAEDIAEGLKSATRPSEIAQAVSDAGPEAVAIAGGLGAERPARDWLQRLRKVRLDIDGADLIEAGIEQGPAVGRGLRAALSAKLDGLTDGARDELEHALRAARAR